MVKDIIKNFSKQLDYEPVIGNADKLQKRDKFIVCGMGGSNLAAGIINGWKPKLDIWVHRDYGLPEMEESQLKNRLIIASSYSGNTEETLSGFEEALARSLPLVVITTGGKLLELAQENQVPYIQMPKIDDNPRFAIGLSIKATLRAMGEEAILNDLKGEAILPNANDYERAGQELANAVKNKIPLIYSSRQNAGLAYYWKINLNETAKIPAFFNKWPELNHNEMLGFDSQIWDGKLADKFVFIFLTDPDDEPQIQKRATISRKVFKDRGFAVLAIDIIGPSLWHKTFAGIVTAMWTGYYLAEHYGVNPENVSMIEDFKKSLAPHHKS